MSKRLAAQRARQAAREQESSSPSSESSEGEEAGEKYLKGHEATESTENPRSAKLTLGDPLLPEHSPLLQELCKEGSGHVGGDRISFCTLVNLLLELSSFPPDLFDPDEIENDDHTPEDICKAAIIRTQERGIEPCALSPLMISVGRKMNARRLGQLTAIYEEFNELSRWGVTSITRSTPEGISKKLRNFVTWCEQSTSKEDRAIAKLLSNVKLKRIEPLTNGLSCLISEFIGIALLNEEMVARVATLVEWLKAMASSSIRPLRLTAVVCLSIVVECLLNKSADALTAWTQTTSQYQTERNIAVRNAQMDSLHSMGRSIVSTVGLLLDDIWTESQVRLTDVSWLVVSQTCYLLGTIAAAFPLRTLMAKENRLVLLLTFLTRHESPQVRAIALETSGKLLRAFIESVSPDRLSTTSADMILPVPSSMAELLVYSTELETLCAVKPDAQEVKSKLDRIWTCVLRHLRDSDVRVGVCAGEVLAIFSLLEVDFKDFCGLQDEQISRACSLLFLVDNPCVSTRIAKFIDSALFAKSIVDEAEAKRLMSGGGSCSTLTPEQATAMSTQLSTVVEWLVEYADDDNWKKYHLTGLKAFSTLAPVLQHWDNLWQHICVAFGANTMTSVVEDAKLFKSVRNVSGSWVSQKSAEALLTITLSMLEIRRFSITGITRYAQITDFRDLINEDTNCSWMAQELTSEGLDVTSCGVELWRPKCDVNPKILQCSKADLIKSLRYLPTILRCGKTSPRLQWLALSLTFEIIDAVKGLDVSLEAQVENDLTVLGCLKKIVAITRGIMDGQDNCLSLQGCFSLLRRLSSITEAPEQLLPNSAEAATEPTYRKFTIDNLTKNARSFLTKLERGATTQDDENSLSLSLVLTNILASNDTVNTFRTALETLDDLISIVEYRSTNEKPSDRITSQILDLVWSALTRWCTQLEIRFLAHIHPAVTQLLDGHADQASEIFARFEDKLLSFKEDLDIYKELTSQFINFSARICETLRLKVRSFGDDRALDSARKSAIIAAVRIVKYMIISAYYHTMTTLWYLIQRDMMNLRRMNVSSVVTLNVLEVSKEIESLCVSCREPPPTESTQEVSYFVDFLKSISSGADRNLKFDSDWLEYGLLSQFHTPRNLLPQTVNNITVCDAYSTIVTEEKSEAFLKKLPEANVLACTYHVQLLATLCQVPDVSLWKDATVGPVILSYLRGKSLILQELANVFIGRVILYDKCRRSKLEEIKSGTDVNQRAFLVVNDSPLLVTLILRLLPPMLDRSREKGSNKDIILLAQRIGASLPSTYFLDLPTDEFINVLWMTVKTSWQERVEEGQNSGLLLSLFSNHIFHNRLIKRRWTHQEAKDQSNALKEVIQAEFERGKCSDDRTSLMEGCQDAYHVALGKFLHLAFGGSLHKSSFSDWLPRLNSPSSSSSGCSSEGDEEMDSMAD